MPLSGQSPLTSINEAKELRVAFQPLLLAEFTLVDGTVLRLAPENLDSSEGGHSYGGFDWKPRLKNREIGAIQAVTDNGILQSPQVTFTLADADKELWSDYEVPIGFKGAKVRLMFVFWDPDTDSFSSDYKIVFVGICNAPSADDTSLTVLATNILNLSSLNLPPTPIQRRCPQPFPVSHAARVLGALSEDSDFYACGYSPDVTDGDGTGGTAAARGNNDPDTGLPFTFCTYTREACIARLGNDGAATQSSSYGTPVQIEKDKSGRSTGRFGGISFDPPSAWTGREYLSGDKVQNINNPNEAKFNDFVPMIYGTTFVEPIVMNVNGEANSTGFEVVVGLGQIGPDDFSEGNVQLVIVNDILVPFIANSPDQGIFFWEWVNIGRRDGLCNRDSLFRGRGDPYGSMTAIYIRVPKQVAESSSIPSVRILTGGPKIRVWASGNPQDFTREYTNNASWVLADVLTWCNLKATALENDLNLDAFGDFAAYSNANVTYTDLTGSDVTHSRYQLGFAIRDRRSAADLIKNLLNSCKAILVPEDDGKLGIRGKETLADQQPIPVAGSNDNRAFDSATAQEDAASGYVAYHFTLADILRVGPERDSPLDFKIEQRPISDTPNRIGIGFQDQDYSYAPDSLNVVDSLDVSRAHQEVNGGLPAEGIVNFDQGKRCIETQMAEAYRGNPRGGTVDLNGDGIVDNDSGGTWIADFATSFKAIRLRVGQIIAITLDKYRLDAQLFRITAISPTGNYERVRIRAAWHEDDWYLDRYGQNPDPLLQVQRRQRLLRPPFGWLPDYEAPWSGDVIWDPTEKFFGLSQVYSSTADNIIIAQLIVRGSPPVNVFSLKTSPPYAPQATKSNSGGTIKAGTYYLALCAVDADGLLTAPSFPVAKITTTGTSSTITLPNIYWQPGTSGYKLYAGTNPNRLSKQKEASGTPSSITITAYKVADQAMPDVMFDSMETRIKVVDHSGVFGAAVTAVSATTVTLGGNSFATNEWADRKVSIIGRSANIADLPIWDFHVVSNTADVLTLTATDLVALGVKVGDVLVMRTAPDIVSANTIGDSKFVNEVDYFDPPDTILAAAGTPILITVASPHIYHTGDTVRIEGVLGNDAANGDWTVTVPSTGDPTYDATHFTLDSSASNGDYVGGGFSKMITNGLRVDEEIDRIIIIISGTGRGQQRRVISNTTTTFTIDGTWGVLPDATSVFIVVDEAWLYTFGSSSMHVQDPSTTVEMKGIVSNFLGQVLWAQVFTKSSSGRYSINSDSPGREIYMYGGPGNVTPVYDKATFNIHVASDLEVATDVAPHYIVRQPGPPQTCEAKIKVPSVGADVILDIKYTPPGDTVGGGSTVSVFPAGPKITLPAGSGDVVVITTFATNMTFEENGILTCDVTQIGSTTPGQCVTIVFKWRTN